MPSTSSLLGITLHLMRRGGRAIWARLVALGVVVSFTEAIGAALIFGLVASAAGGHELSDALPSSVIATFPWLANLEELGLTFAIGGFFILRAALSAWQSFAGNRAVFKTSVSISKELIAKYMAQGYRFHIERGSANLIRNVRDSVDVIAHHVLVPLIRSASELLVSLGLIAALLVIAPGATLILLGSLFVVGALTFVFVRAVLTPLGRQSHDASEASLKAAQELLRGIRDIKLLASDANVRDPFNRAQQSWGRANYRRSTVQVAPRIVAETTLALILLGLLARSGSIGLEGSDTIALVGVFAYAAIRLIPAAVQVFGALNGMAFGAPSLMTVYADLEMEAETQPEEPSKSSPTTFSFAESISFNEVSYRYPGSAKASLRDVTLEILQGDVTGVVGPSGSGKSTLVDLLIGLLKPNEGTIDLDGMAIQSVQGWRQALGVVSQLPYIADDTVTRNIAFGEHDDHINGELVERLARLVRISDFALPERGGLDLVLGEQGFELSGGERQRIALARALYRQPEILILDEATSALDSATEAVVLAGVRAEMKDKTVVIVAHRTSAIRHSDRIIMLVNGIVASSGSFATVTESDEFQHLMGAEDHLADSPLMLPETPIAAVRRFQEEAGY